MFIYSGKLKWQGYGEDETFVIILPNGPVRVGDSAYLFFQWTVDAKGVKKPNWFQNLIVSKASKTQSGDDTFVLAHHYYSWEITTQQVYGKLNVTMSNPTNFKSTMTLDRIWQSRGEQSTGTARIWTGKINWVQFASNEMAIFIVPEGFGDGKPVLSLWQWTVDGSGNKKSPSFREAVQKLESGAGNGVKFSYHSYYDLTCTWDKKTEKLAVHMKGPEANKDLGEFSLSAIIERHSHDFNPPEPTTEKVGFEARLPRAQPSLPRILTPMPFPRTLIDTLAHTASFVDQAGYLAKYAMERFNALDADFHVRGQQLDTASSQIGQLKGEIQKLTGDLNVEKAKSIDLEKTLKAARDQAADDRKALTDKINKLEDDLRQGTQHDAEDHQALEAARKAFEAERVAKDELRKLLDAAQLEKSRAEASLEAALVKISSLEGKVHDLEVQLNVETNLNATLDKENAGLKKELKDLTAKLRQTQSDLSQAQQDLSDAQDGNADKDNEILRVTGDRDRAIESLKAKETAYGKLNTQKQNADAKIRQLEKEVKALREASNC
ncbi:Fc.00g094120.m01.CDS01 [Cosmosporella sp. VM-42]